MKNIFVYGTLMFDEVWRQLISNHYRRIDAELTGFKRLKVKGEDYPGIIPSEGKRVSGELIFNVSTDDVKQLDIFEGEYYRRDKVTIISGKIAYLAETYVFKERYCSLLSKEEWSARAFQKSGLSSFLARYNYFKQT